MGLIKNDTLEASLMVAELSIMLGPTINRINPSHEGLSSREREALIIMRAALQGVQDQAKEMARALLIASQKPDATVTVSG